jgi:hypothetical protein
MKSTWQSLAWKEWHEHKWKLASIIAIMWCVTLPAIFQRETDRAGLAIGMLTLCALPLSIFVGLGAAANEQSRCTVSFLQGLPVPIWRVAVLKLLFGIATVVVPLMLTMLLFHVLDRSFDLFRVEPNRPPLFAMRNWYVSYLLINGLLVVSLFIWSAAAGVNRRDEVSAGAAALLIMVGWMTLVVLLAEKTPIFKNSLLLRVIALSTAPGGPVVGDMVLAGDLNRFQLDVALGVAAVAHLALAAWYVGRFARIASREIRSRQQAVRCSSRPDWLWPPRQSRFSAMVWKQARESGPIVVAGLAGVAGVLAVIVLLDYEHYTVRQAAQLLTTVTVMLGFAVALVGGVGIFLNDLSPRLNTFWRSRPIHPDAWFWTKFLSGGAILYISFCVPLLDAVFVDSPVRLSALVLIPLAVYSSAVATTALVRQAVYAAILSIPLIYFGLTIVWLVLHGAAYVNLIPWPRNSFFEPSVIELAVGMTITIAISTSMAWLAVRYDWGWKNR